MEIRVTIEDAAGAPELAQRLAKLFDPSSISFDWRLSEVRVESEWESRAVRGVVEVVLAWLGDEGPESATLSMGGRSHTLTRRQLSVAP